MLHPSFDACFWENFKGHLLASPKPEVLSVSQVVVMKTPGYCWRVLLLKILFIFSIYMHPLEKAMAPHSSVLAWRIPGKGEPAGLPVVQSRTRLKRLSSSSSTCILIRLYMPFSVFVFCSPSPTPFFVLLFLPSFLSSACFRK